MSTMYRFCWLTMLLAAVCLSSGCGGSAPTPQAADEKGKQGEINSDTLREAARKAGGDLDAPTPTAPPLPTKTKPDIVISAIDFQKNAAHLNYQGKLVRLTGEVIGYQYYTPGRYSLMLNGGAKRSDAVICPIQGTEAWKTALPGQSVTLQATPPVRGPLEWEVTKVEGDPPPTITADQLAKDYGDDPDGVNARDKGKHFVMTGEISKTEIVGDQKSVVVTLKTAREKPVVRCEFPGVFPPAETAPQSLKPGEKIRVTGKYYEFNSSPDSVRLDYCYLLDAKR